MSPPSFISELLAGRTLTEPATEELFESILSGNVAEHQIAAILTQMQSRGVTIDELVGAARVMRRHVTRVPVDVPGAVVIDTCGTGGAPKTFNISTAVAIVVAAASPHRSGSGTHIVVAKHGNRSRSGRGSAEVLSKLGVNVDATPKVQARCLREAGVCFCFAIHHHPATRYVAGVRKTLGFPTIFNLLGPLTNPAAASRQLIGIYEQGAVEKMAHALSRLGSERAMVVHGFDGMDEITTTDRTWVGHVERGSVHAAELDPATFGLSASKPEQLQAHDLSEAARLMHDVLLGLAGAPRDIVLLNAAAALVVSGASPDIAQGMQRAAASIDSGEAGRTLETLARISNEAA
jgi:anthranilate phosphoribosyltransferase